jgi:hypothetical protein
MAAGYANHVCVYCRKSRSIRTGDHVFARSFFAEDRRANLPKAPACLTCGNKKSAHEHYLATVLPFGGMHGDATRNLNTLVEPKLARNQRLQRELAAGFEGSAERPDGSAAIPFETGHLRSLFEMVAQGLLWHHRKIYLPESHSVVAFTPPEETMPELTKLYQLGGDKVVGDVGQGTFRYAANIAHNDAAMSVWFFQIMEGLKLTGDPERPDAIVSAVVAVTGTHSSIDLIKRVWLKEDL